MKLKLSNFDRTLIATAHRQIPWQGTEDVVLSLYKLGEALQLQQALKLSQGKSLEQLSRAPTFTAELAPDQVELLCALVAGGGQAIKGDVGPILGELIARIRKACPRPAAPKEVARA